MKVVTITIDQVSAWDDGQSAHERHQIIMSEDEEFLGVVLVYTTKPIEENELTSS